jgi:hypothetical protein
LKEEAPTLPTPAPSRRQLGAAFGSVSGGQVAVRDRNAILTNNGVIVFAAPRKQREAPWFRELPTVRLLAAPPEPLGSDEKLCWTEPALGSSSSVELHAGGIIQNR